MCTFLCADWHICTYYHWLCILSILNCIHQLILYMVFLKAFVKVISVKISKNVFLSSHISYATYPKLRRFSWPRNRVLKWVFYTKRKKTFAFLNQDFQRSLLVKNLKPGSSLFHKSSLENCTWMSIVYMSMIQSVKKNEFNICIEFLLLFFFHLINKLLWSYEYHCFFNFYLEKSFESFFKVKAILWLLYLTQTFKRVH